VTGLGTSGSNLHTGFDITAASETMAILSVARDVSDLRERLGRITVARTFEGTPVTAEDLGAAGAMTVLLKNALKPNLVQTLEGNPAVVHCGPFANIAHGNSSLVGDLLGLRTAEFVVTEGGFGSDMGFEKHVHLVCRRAGFHPSAVVIVATLRALRHHGGGDLAAGAANLERHIRIVEGFGVQPVVAVNRFPEDSDADVTVVRRLAIEHGAFAAEATSGYSDGGAGAGALAEAVAAAVLRPSRLEFAYDLDDPIAVKIAKLARRVYGAADIELSLEAEQAIAACDAEGLDRLPICMAKTPLSLSHDPALLNAPRDFVLPIRELRAYTGAGWLVALCGGLLTMPGLSAHPAALDIDVDADGRTVGLR
jgi:formyltetrahydrofolate synthetase